MLFDKPIEKPPKKGKSVGFLVHKGTVAIDRFRMSPGKIPLPEKEDEDDDDDDEDDDDDDGDDGDDGDDDDDEDDDDGGGGDDGDDEIEVYEFDY